MFIKGWIQLLFENLTTERSRVRPAWGTQLWDFWCFDGL